MRAHVANIALGPCHRRTERQCLNGWCQEESRRWSHWPGSALEAGCAAEGAEDIWEEELSCWRWNKVLVSTGHCSAARNSPLGPALLTLPKAAEEAAETVEKVETSCLHVRLDPAQHQWASVEPCRMRFHIHARFPATDRVAGVIAHRNIWTWLETCKALVLKGFLWQ